MSSYQDPLSGEELEAEAATGTSFGYHQVADKVGLVPNVRGKDNLLQGLICLAFVLIGGGIGGMSQGDLTGVLTGVLVGLIAGGLLSGGALMVIGLFRK
ncbi:MAG: hypothetical protein AAF682_21825 [Planctomycetota bacterium]